MPTRPTVEIGSHLRTSQMFAHAVSSVNEESAALAFEGSFRGAHTRGQLG
jgi:hypothetical protein